MTDYLYASEIVDEGFEILDDTRADIALQTVVSNNAERDRLIRLADDMIARYTAQKQAINEEYERKNEWHIKALRTYFDRVEKHETKTQASYRLLSGRLVRKHREPTYTRDEEALIAWAKAAAPMFVQERTTERLDWAWLKKEITVVGGQAHYKETGEAVPGIEVIDRDDEFIVEGGK